MKIDTELTRKVAKTARLTLTKAEEDKFTQDLQEILKAFSILDTVNVKDIKSSFRPIEQRDVLREDEEKTSVSQSEALKFTQNKKDGFFIGPRTVE